MLTIHFSDSRVEFSPALRSEVTTFYERDLDSKIAMDVKYIRKCFIGNFPDSPDGALDFDSWS